jgi:hypothetical protein
MFCNMCMHTLIIEKWCIARKMFVCVQTCKKIVTEHLFCFVTEGNVSQNTNRTSKIKNCNMYGSSRNTPTPGHSRNLLVWMCWKKSTNRIVSMRTICFEFDSTSAPRQLHRKFTHRHARVQPCASTQRIASIGWALEFFFLRIVLLSYVSVQSSSAPAWNNVNTKNSQQNKSDSDQKDALLLCAPT